MKKLTALLTATALTASFAASAASTNHELQLQVSTDANRAVVNVLNDGAPLTNYPMTIKGLNSTMNKVTSDQGTVTITNHGSHPQRVTFIVTDPQGNTVTKQRFIARES
ncbi:hypothetical protein ACFODT_11605 [Vibrio zhugei]|uniref:Uncharacterized protein n=1 Tax=Vibrio zhugei TaxID=2479546 RepID=A0ABV7CD77_9VIBR|nr:hypothetical protein [Vibrio zhugei]